MQQSISEVKITAPSINQNDELVFRCRVKREDWTQELKDFIYNLNATWNTVAMALVQIEDKPHEDPLPKLRQQLAMTIKEYCEVWWYNEEDELSKFYQKRWISSRTELTKEELEDAVDSYRAGVNQFKN